MQHRGPRRLSNEQRAPGWAVLAAVFGVLLAGIVAIPGCLNPRPEEDPSALELADPQGSSADPADDGAPAVSEVDRETCDGNAQLAGCEPASPSPGANVETPSPPSEEPSAGPTDGGAPDGSDAGAADAGAAAPGVGSALAE